MRRFLALLAARVSSPIGWFCASCMALIIVTLALVMRLPIAPEDAFVMGLFLGASVGWAIEWRVYRHRYFTAALQARDHILQLPLTLSIPYEQRIQTYWAELESHAVSPAEYFASLRTLRQEIAADLVDFYALVAEGAVSPSALRAIEGRRRRATKDTLTFPDVEEDDLLGVIEARPTVQRKEIASPAKNEAESPGSNVSDSNPEPVA